MHVHGLWLCACFAFLWHVLWIFIAIAVGDGSEGVAERPFQLHAAHFHGEGHGTATTRRRRHRRGGAFTTSLLVFTGGAAATATTTTTTTTAPTPERVEAETIAEEGGDGHGLEAAVGHLVLPGPLVHLLAGHLFDERPVHGAEGRRRGAYLLQRRRRPVLRERFLRRPRRGHVHFWEDDGGDASSSS